jgi:VanZ family protein
MASNLDRVFAVFWWLLTLAWAGLIFYLSTQTFASDFSRGVLAGTLDFLHIQVSPETFAFLHALLRKLAHLTEYGIFAMLLYCLPGRKSQVLWQPRRAATCILVAALYSMTDEFHQLHVHGRNASLLDCGLDTIGASLAMLVPYTQKQLSLLRSIASLSRVKNP